MTEMAAAFLDAILAHQRLRRHLVVQRRRVAVHLVLILFLLLVFLGLAAILHLHILRPNWIIAFLQVLVAVREVGAEELPRVVLAGAAAGPEHRGAAAQLREQAAADERREVVLVGPPAQDTTRLDLQRHAFAAVPVVEAQRAGSTHATTDEGHEPRRGQGRALAQRRVQNKDLLSRPQRGQQGGRGALAQQGPHLVLDPGAYVGKVGRAADKDNLLQQGPNILLPAELAA